MKSGNYYNMFKQGGCFKKKLRLILLILHAIIIMLSVKCLVHEFVFIMITLKAEHLFLLSFGSSSKC